MRPWNPWLKIIASPTERFYVRTKDGVRLTVNRVRSSRSKIPVMLLHGLGANRHTFLFPGVSLAAYLADHGFDCFIPELRGSGESRCLRFKWDVDCYLENDLPAILHGIRTISGKEKLHWVGHSLGGVLLFCYGMKHPDSKILSGLSIGSALDSIFKGIDRAK